MAKLTDRDLIIKLRADTLTLKKDLARAKMQMSSFGKSMTSIGKQLRGMMLGALAVQSIISGIKSVVRNLATFELQMKTIEAVTGATTITLGKLQEQALSLGASTKFTAGEIASMQLALAKLGFSSGEILKTADAIQKLSVVTGEDLAEAASGMAGTLRSFNLAATDSFRVANVMAESFSKTSLTLEKFTVGTANVGAVANATGVTLEQNTARLGTLTNANIDASKAGTDLRRIYIDLNKEGISYSGALAIVRGASDKLATATKLVGVRAAASLIILSEQEDVTKSLALELANAEMEIDGMADTIGNSLATSMKKFSSAIDGIIKKGGAFNGFFKSAVDWATSFATALGNIGNQEEAISDAAIKAGKALGTANSKSFIQSLKDRAKWNEKVARSQGAVNKTIAQLAKPNSPSSIRDLNSHLIQYNFNLLKFKTAQEANIKVLQKYNSQAKISAELQKKQNEALKQGAIDAAAYAYEIERIANQSRASNATLMKPKDGERVREGINGLSMPVITKEGLDEAMAANRDAWTKYTTAWNEEFNHFENIINAGFQMVLAASITEGFSQIGTAIGGGGASLEDAFKSILSILGNGMKQIGAALIAQGVALEVGKKALKAKNGFALIAAGGALVVAGAALNAAISNESSALGGGGGGSRGGGGSGGTGRFDFNRESQALSGEFVVRGTDLVLALNNQATQDNRNVAG